MFDSILSLSPVFLYPLLAGLFFALLQIVVFMVGGLDFGESLADMIDGSDFAEVFDWLNLGKVPLSILLMTILTSFGSTGLLVASSLPFVPTLVAAVAAAPVAIGVTKIVGDLIARFIPKDETYAVSTASLIGRTGVVTLGPLDTGLPGTVRIRDEHGDLHSLRARPVDDDVVIAQGQDIVVVSVLDGPGQVHLVMPLDDGPRILNTL